MSSVNAAFPPVKPGDKLVIQGSTNSSARRRDWPVTFGAQKHETSLQVGASPISFPALLPPTSIWASPSPSPHPARRGLCCAGQRMGSEPPLPSLQLSMNSLSLEARGAAPSTRVAGARVAQLHCGLRTPAPEGSGWVKTLLGARRPWGALKKRMSKGKVGMSNPPTKSLERPASAHRCPRLPRLRLRVPVRPSRLSPPRKPVPPATGPPLSWPHLGVLPRCTASRPSPPGPLLPSASGAS